MTWQGGDTVYVLLLQYTGYARVILIERGHDAGVACLGDLKANCVPTSLGDMGMSVLMMWVRRQHKGMVERKRKQRGN
jgi:hypothetical protein